MYKLLIVEDEKWEREGLLDFLNWEEMGIEVVGCACNGVEGERIAKALRPQIIITDIRMPVLDGILMSQNIRHFLPDTKIIMLTGYDDFEYAKQTFSFQAFAYLLKPVQKKEIVDIIVNVLEKLEDEKNHQKKKTELESQYVDYYQKNCDHMLVDYLSNKFELKAIQSLQPLIKLKAPGKKVVAIIYFCLNSAISNKKQDFQNVFLNTMKSFNHMLGETGIAASCGELPEEAVLCMQAPSTRRELENILLNIMQEFRAKTGVQCIAGIGAVVDGLELTPRSYAQAREAIGFRFLASYGELIFYSSISYTECRNKAVCRLMLDECNLLSSKIVHEIQKGSIVKSETYINKFLEMLIENRAESKNLLNHFILEIVNDLNMLLPSDSENGVYVAFWDPDKHGVDYSILNSLNHTKKYLIGILDRISINTKKSFNEDHIARKVIEIIEKMYQEKLDLNRVADEIHLSPYYIGSLFKEYTGKHFNQYLNGLRIEKAKEILDLKSIKISDLAQKVGIPNPSYFCSLFKKKFAISPKEYMEMMSRRNAGV